MVLKASPRRRLVVQALKNPRRPPTPCQKRSKLRGRVREEGEEEEGKDFDDLRGKGNKREGVAAYLSMVRKVGEGAPTSFGGARAWRRRAGPVVVSRGAGGGVWRSSKGGPAAASGGGATAGRRRRRAEERRRAGGAKGEGELRGQRAGQRNGGADEEIEWERVLEVELLLGWACWAGQQLYLPLLCLFLLFLFPISFHFLPVAYG